MKKNILNTVVFLGVLTMGMFLFAPDAMAQTAKKAQSANTQAEEQDGNGCDFSKGYVYSVVMEKCIRPSEAGTAMAAVGKSKSAAKAFVVRNPKEKAAEVFLPGKKEGIVFGMDVSATVPTWKAEDMVLTNDPKQGWKLEKEEQLLFASKA